MKDNLPSTVPDTATSENCKFFIVVGGGKVSNIIRLKATGFWCLVEDNVCERLKKAGASVLWVKPAESVGFVGTISGGEVHEIAYDLPDGSRRYCYTLVSAFEDSYTQECWTTVNRLTANAAADTILAARKIAYARRAD